MKVTLRSRFIVLLDLVCITAAFIGSVLLRLDRATYPWPYPLQYLAECQYVVLASLLIRVPLYAGFGLYRRMWRSAGIREVGTIAAAATLGSVLVFAANWLLLPALGLPPCYSRSVLVIDWILNLALLSTSRLCLRLAAEAVVRHRLRSPRRSAPRSRNVLVVGAGSAGSVIVREMRDHRELRMVPVGFLDDDPAKRGMRSHGVRVLGSCDLIPALAEREQIDEVLIAIPSASGEQMRRIKGLCREAGLRYRTMPGIYELLDGKVSIKQLREVRIEDLLRREPIVVDPAPVAAYVRGARIMVTGAGGSIGSELCRQLARHQPAQMIILGHGEGSIFKIEQELKVRFPAVPLTAVIADVRDANQIDHVVAAHQPAVIFHAAAHKHVPLMENNNEEAFTNNVAGTWSVLRAAERNNVGRFLLISTDKAVNPSSVMGTTKRVAELLVREAGLRTGRPYVAVRFGNVLGSRGSALPIFQDQIAAGGPVTITHPEMRRYFMTIPEAAQLVLHAAALGKGGEVFMLDMGDPVRMVDLATDLIELSGLTPGVDVEIVYTGMRPGEKLCEELHLNSEQYGPTAMSKIFVCRDQHGAAMTREALDRKIHEMKDLAAKMVPGAVAAELQRLVPEFQPPKIEAVPAMRA